MLTVFVCLVTKNSSDAGNESNGPSTATVGNLQIFLDNFVCQANANGTAYFFFEYFDEVWKDEEFGGVEGWWGLFTSKCVVFSIYSFLPVALLLHVTVGSVADGCFIYLFSRTLKEGLTIPDCSS